MAGRELAIPPRPSHAGAMTSDRSPPPAATPRATRRPAGFAKPAHWTSEPPPAPAEPHDEPDPEGLSPTRYGDWTRKGIAWDF